jgi:RNA polymerase sigma-70 factor (ECF subfamily)
MLKDRNEQSFSYLYNHYSGAVYSIILQVVPDKGLANDVLQEAFINIWRKVESYDPLKGRLFTWMLNIARNLAIDTLRSKSYLDSKKNEELPELNDYNHYHHSTHLKVDDIGLKKIVQKLKSEHSVLIDLAYFKGYTHEEIADIEDIPLGTVKTRIRTALIQLREHLK